MKLLLFVLTIAVLLLGPIALDVAHAATAAPVWLVPAGLTCPQTCKPGNLNADFAGHTHIGLDTGVWRSEGYDPGTSWSTLAFGCPASGEAWLGQDDDDTGAGVKFAAPLQIGGIRYLSLGWSGYPHTYPHRNTIDLSMDGIHWTNVANISASLPFNTWTPVQATWTPVTTLYLRWFTEDDGSFTNMAQARLLVAPSTAKVC